MHRIVHAALAAILTTFVAGCLGDTPPTEEPATSSTESALSGGQILSMIAVNLDTGGDDKRSDSRVWLRVRMWNGNYVVQEIGYGQTFPDWTWSGWFYINLPSVTRVQDIAAVDLLWQQGGGGFNGDNWNLQQMQIYALDAYSGQWSYQSAPWGNPLYRFTGSATFYAAPWYY